MTTNSDSSLFLRSGKTTLPLISGAAQAFKAKAGEHYRIVNRHGDDEA